MLGSGSLLVYELFCSCSGYYSVVVLAASGWSSLVSECSDYFFCFELELDAFCFLEVPISYSSICSARSRLLTTPVVELLASSAFFFLSSCFCLCFYRSSYSSCSLIASRHCCENSRKYSKNSSKFAFFSAYFYFVTSNNWLDFCSILDKFSSSGPCSSMNCCTFTGY